MRLLFASFKELNQSAVSAVDLKQTQPVLLEFGLPSSYSESLSSGNNLYLFTNDAYHRKDFDCIDSPYWRVIRTIALQLV